MPEAVLDIVKSTVDVTGLSDNDFTAQMTGFPIFLILDTMGL